MILYFISMLLACIPEVESSFANQFFYKPTQVRSPAPQLVLISGCTGVGKSTFGMEVALNKGIVKCISTDTVRQVMRTFSDNEALQRSSYGGTEDPILQWKESCSLLSVGVNSLVMDCINRGVSIVIEGVNVLPCNDLINKWTDMGGIAIGCLLTISDENTHRDLIFKRGEIMSAKAEEQIKSFDRIRAIQAEMIRLAKENNWILIEQQVQPDPIDIVTELLDRSPSERITESPPHLIRQKKKKI